MRQIGRAHSPLDNVRNYCELVTLIKTDGQEIANINAQAGSSLFILEDGQLPIEEGDTFRRVLGNGLIEEYTVLDRGYNAPSPRLTEHYQAKVQKTDKHKSVTPQPNLAGMVNINISGGNIGLLNTGQVNDVQSIAMNVSALQESGKTDIAQAFKDITESVTSHDIISEDVKTEVIEQLDALSKEATSDPKERSKTGVITAVIGSLATTLTAVDKVSEVWQKWEPHIKAYFGLK